MDWLKDWRDRWCKTVAVILDPQAIILYIITGFLLYASVSQDTSVNQPDRLLTAILVFMLSAVSGLLGAILQDRATTLNQKGPLKAKGSSAVRSLKLHLNAIFSLRNRASECLSRCRKPETTPQFPSLVQAYFEEIVGQCHLLAAEVVGSIENWKDIVPEADVKTDIDSMERLEQKAKQDTAEILTLKDQLAKVTGSKEEKELQIKRLENQLREKTQELQRTQEEWTLKHLRTGIGGSALGWRVTRGQFGLSLSPEGFITSEALPGDIPNATFTKRVTCKHCGAEFDTPIFQVGETECPTCRKLQ